MYLELQDIKKGQSIIVDDTPDIFECYIVEDGDVYVKTPTGVYDASLVSVVEDSKTESLIVKKIINLIDEFLTNEYKFRIEEHMDCRFSNHKDLIQVLLKNPDKLQEIAEEFANSDCKELSDILDFDRLDNIIEENLERNSSTLEADICLADMDYQICNNEIEDSEHVVSFELTAYFLNRIFELFDYTKDDDFMWFKTYLFYNYKKDEIVDLAIYFTFEKTEEKEASLLGHLSEKEKAILLRKAKKAYEFNKNDEQQVKSQ